MSSRVQRLAVHPGALSGGALKNCRVAVAELERLMPAIRTADCRSPLMAKLVKATDVDETRFEVRGQVSGLA